jgi:hypothetical protein
MCVSRSEDQLRVSVLNGSRQPLTITICDCASQFPALRPAPDAPQTIPCSPLRAVSKSLDSGALSRNPSLTSSGVCTTLAMPGSFQHLGAVDRCTLTISEHPPHVNPTPNCRHRREWDRPSNRPLARLQRGAAPAASRRKLRRAASVKLREQPCFPIHNTPTDAYDRHRSLREREKI